MPGPFDLQRPLAGPNNFGGPRVLGPSSSVPGAIDVDTGEGIFAFPPDAVASMMQQPGGMGAGPQMANAGDVGFDQYGLGGEASVAADVPPSFLQPQAPATEFERRYGGAASPLEALQAGLPPSVAASQTPLSREVQAAQWDARQRARAAESPLYAAQPGRAAPGEVTLPSPAAQPASGGPPGGDVYDQYEQQLLANAFAQGRGGGGSTRAERAELERLGTQGEELFQAQRQGLLGQGRRAADLAGAQNVERMMGQERAAMADEERAAVRRTEDEERQRVDGELQQHRDRVASGAINPDRLLGDGLTGGRILAAIASGLGAYSAALTGGRNFALETINEGIDRDIEAQRAQLETNNEALRNTETYYGQMMARFQNNEQAHHAARAEMLTEARDTTANLALSAEGPEAQERASMMVNALDQQANEARAAAIQEGVRRRGGGRRGGSVSEQVAALGLAERRRRAGPGGAGGSQSAGERTRLEQTDIMLDNISQRIALREQAGGGGEVLNRRLVQHGEMLANQATTLEAVIGGQGAQTDREFERQRSQHRSPAEVSVTGAVGATDTVMESLLAEREVWQRRRDIAARSAAGGGAAPPPERFEEQD